MTEAEQNAIWTAAIEAAEAEARRYAAMYTEGSDGRNTFIIYADCLHALTRPSDMVLVPREPTLKMLQAGTMEYPTWDHETNRKKYRAMIAARGATE